MGFRRKSWWCDGKGVGVARGKLGCDGPVWSVLRGREQAKVRPTIGVTPVGGRAVGWTRMDNRPVSEKASFSVKDPGDSWFYA